MLTRRIFRQLTDRVLSPSLHSPCFCAGASRSLYPAPSLSSCFRRSLASRHVVSPLVRPPQRRLGSSSSTRWKNRQGRDQFAREAKVQGLKSRAAFKLIQLNEKHRLFRKGDTVIDLGYAPGSWSQVAASLTRPTGRVIGIDVIPAQPPAGVSTIQGDFLSPDIRAAVREYVADPMRGRPWRGRVVVSPSSTAANQGGVEEEEHEGKETEDVESEDDAAAATAEPYGIEDDTAGASVVDLQRRDNADVVVGAHHHAEMNAIGGDRGDKADEEERRLSRRQRDERAGRVVDIVLSDMCEPWEQTTGFWQNSVSDPYGRMMNASGVAVRDHGGSMDLCDAALAFCHDALRTGGHFVCKFYQGGEDRALEARLRRLFEKVHREKPDSSRQESKEAYFVALRRKDGVDRETVWSD